MGFSQAAGDFELVFLLAGLFLRILSTLKGLRAVSFHWHQGHEIEGILNTWKKYDNPYPAMTMQINEVVDWMHDLKMDIVMMFLDEPVGFLSENF
jgi:hypothetical protein